MKKLYTIILYAVIIFPVPLHALTVSILHTTDTHGNLSANEQIAELFQHYSTPYTIIIDCGDTVQGTFSMAQCKGKTVPAILNKLNYDIWIPGNHDLDFGIEAFNCYRNAFTGSMLAGNWIIDGAPMPGWKMFEFNGIKIAVIGLSRTDQPYRTLCTGYSLTTETERNSLLRILPQIRNAGADAIILARHAGNYDQSGNLWQLLKEFPEIDLVLGGHTHQNDSGAPCAGSFYAQAGSHAENLGVVTMEFDDHSGELIQISGKLVPMPEVQEKLPATRMIAELEEDIQLPRRKTLNHPLAEIGAKAMLEVTRADLAFHGNRAKNYRYSRNIDEATLFRMFPFEDYVITFEVYPDELLELLTEQMQTYKSESYSFYVAGCEVIYDDSGKAIATTLPRKEKYTLAVSAFTFSGGNGRFQTMRKLMEKRDYKLNGLLRDCVRNFLTQ